MNKVKIFRVEESACHPGKYMIMLDHAAFHCTYTTGSYNVLMARLMGLTYADFLRLCRDEFQADLVGKNCMYVVPYFNNELITIQLVAMLNARANLILMNRKYGSSTIEKQEFLNFYDRKIARRKRQYDRNHARPTAEA